MNLAVMTTLVIFLKTHTMLLVRSLELPLEAILMIGPTTYSNFLC